MYVLMVITVSTLVRLSNASPMMNPRLQKDTLVVMVVPVANGRMRARMFNPLWSFSWASDRVDNV